MADTACLFLSPKIPWNSKNRLLLSPVLAYNSSIGKCVSTRKNRLRPKLLKLVLKRLDKVPIPVKEPEFLFVPSPPRRVTDDSLWVDNLNTDDEVLSTDEIVETYTSSVGYGEGAGVFTAKSVLKFGAYVFGVLLFQTISAVLIFGVSHSVKEEQNSYLKQTWTNEGVPHMDEEEVERKVIEIRELARMVREREKSEKDQVEMAGARVESEIEKEIVSRLSKVDEKFEDAAKDLLWQSLPLERPGHITDDVESDETGGVESLMFEKRSSTASSGIMNMKKFSPSSSEYTSGLVGNDVISGASEDNETTSPDQVQKSLEDPSSQNQQTLALSFDTEMIAVSRVIRQKQDDVQTDIWWLGLPYVLAILMRQNSDDGTVLYALSSTSETHIVAFEDHKDASNFCFLLESYFNDVKDFHADIIPCSTEDLKCDFENAKKMLVVKKGQLNLYAGQPLTDVEEALHSLLVSATNFQD